MEDKLDAEQDKKWHSSFLERFYPKTFTNLDYSAEFRETFNASATQCYNVTYNANGTNKYTNKKFYDTYKSKLDEKVTAFTTEFTSNTDLLDSL